MNPANSKNMLKDSNMTKTQKAKVEMILWMIETMLSDENLPMENRVAFRRWLIEDSDAELKIEALRLMIQKRSEATYNQEDVDQLPGSVREGWRDIAQKLGMDADLEKYRAIWKERREFGYTIQKQSAQKQSRQIPLWRKYAFRAAAVLLPVLILAGYWYLHTPEDVVPDTPALLAQVYVATHVVETGQDSVKYVTLADGTLVTMNRNSRLSYNDNREAELSGEAYFKVAKDAAHPFVIHSDKVKVTVLGTEFNFSADAGKGNSTLSLYEGVVQLDSEAGTHRLDGAGKEYHFDHVTGQCLVDDFECTQEPEWIAWENLYKYYSLGEILHSIQNEYDVVFENMNAIDTIQRISFRLHDGKPIEALMYVLKEASGDFDYTINGKTITLKSLK